MKKLDFYEFTGIVAPGAVAVYGLSRIHPEVGLLLKDQSITVGELGLLLILAYVAGHIIQSFGNLLEKGWWFFFGGMPSDWPRTGKRQLLAASQMQVLPSRIRSVLKLECSERLSDLSKNDWFAITRQIYSTVRLVDRTDRIDVFNGNYGMFRGIAASLLLLLAVAIIDTQVHDARVYAVLGITALLAFFRMHRFGVQYARELFVQFLSIKSADSPEVKKESNERDNVS